MSTISTYQIDSQKIILTIFEYVQKIIDNHDIELFQLQKEINTSIDEDEINSIMIKIENNKFNYQTILDACGDLQNNIVTAKKGSLYGLLTYEDIKNIHTDIMLKDLETINKLNPDSDMFKIYCKKSNIARKTREEILNKFNCL